MPKSKKRGGAKKHNKRVANRNAHIKDEKNKVNKHRQDVFENMMKEYEKQEMLNQSSIDSEDSIEGIDGPEI